MNMSQAKTTIDMMKADGKKVSMSLPTQKLDAREC